MPVGQFAQNLLGLGAGKLVVRPNQTSEYVLFYCNNNRGVVKQRVPHFVNAWAIIGLVTKSLFYYEIQVSVT
jgi:hypothetical protein